MAPTSNVQLPLHSADGRSDKIRILVGRVGRIRGRDIRVFSLRKVHGMSYVDTKYYHVAREALQVNAV